MVNTETIRFRLNPVMSYVPPEVRATDAAFWGRKPVESLASAKSSKPTATSGKAAATKPASKK